MASCYLTPAPPGAHATHRNMPAPDYCQTFGDGGSREEEDEEELAFMAEIALLQTRVTKFEVCGEFFGATGPCSDPTRLSSKQLTRRTLGPCARRTHVRPHSTCTRRVNNISHPAPNLRGGNHRPPPRLLRHRCPRNTTYPLRRRHWP